MASQNFAGALSLVLVHEGGYVDHPKDPGGATNLGITIGTLSAYRGRKVTKAEVKGLTRAEAGLIYKQQYWNAVKGNDLAPGVDYAMFDYAVNSGPGRAIKALQKVLGVKVDGALGVHTLDAAGKADPASLVRLLCAERLAFLKRLNTWGTFGKGWQRRVDGVQRDALLMIQKIEPAAPPATAPVEPAAKADPADRAVTDILKKPEAWGPLAGVVSGIISSLSGSVVLQVAVAIIAVSFAGVGIYALVTRVRAEA